MTTNYERVKEWRKNNPDKVKILESRNNKKKQAKIKLFKSAHPEIYHLTKTGRYHKNSNISPEEKRRRNIECNRKYQRSEKGRQKHNKAAREYARRKYAALKTYGHRQNN